MELSKLPGRTQLCNTSHSATPERVSPSTRAPYGADALNPEILAMMGQKLLRGWA
jgi:hypothetical protein